MSHVCIPIAIKTNLVGVATVATEAKCELQPRSILDMDLEELYKFRREGI